MKSEDKYERLQKNPDALKQNKIGKGVLDRSRLKSISKDLSLIIDKAIEKKKMLKRSEAIRNICMSIYSVESEEKNFLYSPVCSIKVSSESDNDREKKTVGWERNIKSRSSPFIKE